MSDDRKDNFSFGGGFMADMLKGLQDELEISKKPKRKSKRSKPARKPEPSKESSDGMTAMPSGRAAQGTAMPAMHADRPTAAENRTPGHPASDSAKRRPDGILSPDAAERRPDDTLSTTADYRPGDLLLDTYRIDSRPFKGGMGAVWRVHHSGWDVDLAMKRPHPEAFRTQAQKKGFTDECRYWMNLGLHPNIVSCYYVREIDGIPTIFSEWMENGSLESHIKNRTLYEGSEKEVQERLLDIAIQFARGLHYAHENDLIHQDVKPDNLLLDRYWAAKVSDFGLAKARTMLTFLGGTATELEYDPDATMVTPSGGRTPAYCSPEQAAAQLLTRRTDIYSWAVSVLEMYLGDKPWVHGRELTGPLVGSVCRDYFDMCEERPVPKALQDLLAWCLEMDPDDRPRDFGEVETQLLTIYKEETGSAYPRPAPASASDTADSLNNKAISHLDLGEEEEAVVLLEDCVRQRHFDGTLNMMLYRWRTGIASERSMFWAVDELEASFPERRDELARTRKEIYLEACGQSEPPAFRLVTPQGFDGATLSRAIVSDGKLIAVVRKRWKDGNMYYYVCHFDPNTGTLLRQHPSNDEVPGIPCSGQENYTRLFDGGNLMYLDSGLAQERGIYDVPRQEWIKEKYDFSLDTDRFITRPVRLDHVFTRDGEIQPDFQDGVPVIGRKEDGHFVYEIVRAQTWEPCARIAAKKLTWLEGGQFLIQTRHDTFRFYDAEKKTDCLLFSREVYDGQTVLVNPSGNIVIAPNNRWHGRTYACKNGRYILCVHGRFFTIPDLQELKPCGFKERTRPEPRTAELLTGPYELSVREAITGRSLLTPQVPALPVLGDREDTKYRLLMDHDGGFALVYHSDHQVAWAVIDLDFCPSGTPQMRYRITTPVTTAAAMKQAQVDAQRLSSFHKAQEVNSLDGMLAAYHEAVMDDHTGYETLHTMNAILSGSCRKNGLLRVTGAPFDRFRETYKPALLGILQGKWDFSPSGKHYVNCRNEFLRLRNYPAGTLSRSCDLRKLSKSCDDYYAVTSLCIGQKEEVYISYICEMYQKTPGEKDYRVACLGAGLDRDETLLFLPGAEKSRIYLLGTTEDSHFLLLCRDDGNVPATVTLELLDLKNKQIVSGIVINHFAEKGETFRRDDSLRMLCGSGGVMELLWDYAPVPLETPASSVSHGTPVSSGSYGTPDSSASHGSPDSSASYGSPASSVPAQTGFQVENGILVKYLGEDGTVDVVIPDGIVGIGPEAFRDCELIRSVIVPEGVRTIGEAAFRNCDRLEKIKIPSTVDTLPADVFYHCFELDKVENKGSIRHIGARAFYFCLKLRSVQVAYGASIDPDIIFDEQKEKADDRPANYITITQPTTLLVNGYSACKAVFSPVPAE